MLAENNDAKKIFMKKGACSQAFFYMLNREFGHHYELEEIASDPFAGGILRQGYQCGMLWGASLSVGAESYRMSHDLEKASFMAVRATQKLMESFKNLTKSHDCLDITDTDFNSKFQFAKFMVFKAHSCFNLARDWAQDATLAAAESLGVSVTDGCKNCIGCSGVLAKKMGASDAQAAMVAGFAGGMGLSGNACGAFATALWIKSIEWCRSNPGKSPYSLPELKTVYEKFNKITDYKILCSEITGRNFNSLDEHSEFINAGGCSSLIEKLAGEA